MTTKLEIQQEVINDMKELNVYAPEYDKIISIYSGMMLQYSALEEQFQAEGFQASQMHTNKFGAENTKRSPLLTSMESLRKDLLNYSDRLCLNPKTVSTIKIEKKAKSGLVDLLSKMGE